MHQYLTISSYLGLHLVASTGCLTVKLFFGNLEPRFAGKMGTSRIISLDVHQTCCFGHPKIWQNGSQMLIKNSASWPTQSDSWARLQIRRPPRMAGKMMIDIVDPGGPKLTRHNYILRSHVAKFWKTQWDKVEVIEEYCRPMPIPYNSLW